jgi:hypothetical protein
MTMNCKRFTELIFSYEDGQLPARERAEFEAHGRSCPACAEAYAALAETGALLVAGAGDVPVPDWDRSWRRIAAAAAPRPRSRAVRGLFPRWALVAAGFLAFFILGVAFARLGIFRPAAPPAGAGDPAFSFTARDYFSLLQPVMAEYANAQDPGSAVPEDAQRARRLLNDLYLLKLRAENSRERGLLQLLGDIELVLLEMVHLDRSRPESVHRLGELIQEKGLAMKLRVFNSDPRKITKI